MNAMNTNIGLTTDMPVNKKGKDYVEQSINECQHSTEDFGFVLSYKIFAVYWHLQRKHCKQKHFESFNLNEQHHPGNDQKKCRHSVGDQFSITWRQSPTSLVGRRREGWQHLKIIHQLSDDSSLLPHRDDCVYEGWHSTDQHHQLLMK